jgi:MbtH protein
MSCKRLLKLKCLWQMGLTTIEDITLPIEHSSPDNKYLAVVNSEGQYSIWPIANTLPAGWTEAGKRGTQEECLEYTAQVWVDMRPKSLRDKTDKTPTSVADTADASEV